MIVNTHALRKEFYEIVAVRDGDLQIPAGEIFGLIGPNGAGKTTTLRMLATALEPTAGEIEFLGRDLWADPTEARRHIGFMPDFFQMYGQLKVRELLTYFGKAHGLARQELCQRVPAVIDLIGLTDKAESLVKGLSRGMMQRLGVGRAILHRPELLLLDEPASGLDPLGRRELFDLLRAARGEGATIVISSHILAELSGLCTSIAVMQEGRFLETGRTEQIVQRLMPKRQITVRLTTSLEAALALLTGREGVSDVAVDRGQIRFLFEGDDQALASLNAALVAAGVGVALLEERKTDLPELYFAITERNEHGDAPG